MRNHAGTDMNDNDTAADTERTRLLSHSTVTDDDTEGQDAAPRQPHMHVHSNTRRGLFSGLSANKRNAILFLLGTLALVGGLTVGSALHLFPKRLFGGGPPPPRPASGSAAITRQALEHGLATCRKNALAAETNPAAFATGGAPKAGSNRRNPRFDKLTDPETAPETSKKAHPILIKHATLWDGIGGRFPDTDIAIADGLIVKIGKGLDAATLIEAAIEKGSKRVFDVEDVEVIDAEGRVVSPGLVDMHSHVGADSYPSMKATSDENEMSNMLNPQVRVQDAINTMDPGIDIVASGGVTTSLVLPGSGTLMGGEGFPIKMFKTGSSLSSDMHLNSGMNPDGSDGKMWRYMKMACGENPKNFGRETKQMPVSRMGSAWLIRKKLEEATKLVQRQQDWCLSAQFAATNFREDAHYYMSERYPEILEDESLTSLLRGDVRLQVHCYEPNDIEMIVRNSHEFGFPVVALHHAVSAWKVAPFLARENISVALFADHSLFKVESYTITVKAPKILHDAGVKVALKSDHPVFNAQHLIYEAQKAVHYGLDEDVAFAAVTSVPAERIGNGWRIGRLAVGYDADVLIWDRPPLQLGAHPVKVIIDGFSVFSLPFLPEPMDPLPPKEPLTPHLDEPTNFPAYTIINVSEIFQDRGVTESGSIVVEHGIVTCVGMKCKSKGKVFDINGGVVIPGLVSANVHLGLSEIGAEPSTEDGRASVEDSLQGLNQAVDGLSLGGGSKKLINAFRSGVLTSVSSPLKGPGFVQGQSVAFRTGSELYSEAIIKPITALHIVVGHTSKDTYTPSISVQFSRLRQLLYNSTSGPFHDVANGKYPLVATAHDPADITKLLTLTYDPALSLKLIIAGASGAWVVAAEIAKAGVPVLLQSARCVPGTWESRWCRIPGTRPSTFEMLNEAGVRVAASVVEEDQIRGLLWEAGWLANDCSKGNIWNEEAIGAVTWIPSEMFELGKLGVGKVLVGHRANFVGLDGGPIGISYNIQILGDGHLVYTHPVLD